MCSQSQQRIACAVSTNRVLCSSRRCHFGIASTRTRIPSRNTITMCRLKFLWPTKRGRRCDCEQKHCRKILICSPLTACSYIPEAPPSLPRLPPSDPPLPIAYANSTGYCAPPSEMCSPPVIFPTAGGSCRLTAPPPRPATAARSACYPNLLLFPLVTDSPRPGSLPL